MAILGWRKQKMNKYGGTASHFRGPTLKRHREEHEARVDAWQALSPEEQLAELDKRFGVGKGATKQRERIAKAMN